LARRRRTEGRDDEGRRYGFAQRSLRVVISRFAGRDKPCSVILPACSTNVSANVYHERWWEPFASVGEASAIAWRTEHERE
jgi:hypothetical protein